VHIPIATAFLTTMTLALLLLVTSSIAQRWYNVACRGPIYQRTRHSLCFRAASTSRRDCLLTRAAVPTKRTVSYVLLTQEQNFVLRTTAQNDIAHHKSVRTITYSHKDLHTSRQVHHTTVSPCHLSTRPWILHRTDTNVQRSDPVGKPAHAYPHHPAASPKCDTDDRKCDVHSGTGNRRFGGRRIWQMV
jgi:hypothetical protein